MKLDVITIFPELVEPHLRVGLLGKAVSEGLIDAGVHNLRNHGLGKHRSVDDEPYGGGAGMVMRPEPIFDAVDEVRTDSSRILLMSARGRRLDHDLAVELAAEEHLVIICGRYEGVDQRVGDHLADDEVSIGDYVLHGGEVAALVVIEAFSRHIPGVLGNPGSLIDESHASGSLEYPHYTRPAEYRGLAVPEILLSGDHAAVDAWRRSEAERVTQERAEG